MLLVDTLAPLVLLIVLGAGLAHIRFLGSAFMADLNKLAFWIALPALLFTSANNAAAPDAQTWRLLAVLFAATVLITLVALGASFAWRMPGGVRGTLMQSAFRGNLAYIGIPVLAYSFSETRGRWRRSGDGNRCDRDGAHHGFLQYSCGDRSSGEQSFRETRRLEATDPRDRDQSSSAFGAARVARAPAGSNVALFSSACTGIAWLPRRFRSP